MRLSLTFATLSVFVVGCASEPELQYVWTHPETIGQQEQADRATCEAYAYRIAGSPPRQQPVPQCDSSGGGFAGAFACGVQKGQVQSANREAQEAWDKALDAGFTSCMYEKGYSRTVANGGVSPIDQPTSESPPSDRSTPNPRETRAAPICSLSYADNPSVTFAINPNVTYKWNPDVTYTINPNVTFSINPNVTYSLNPNVTFSLNPNVTTSLNPYFGDWHGYKVCSPQGELVGASVIANDEVMVIFTGGNWIGHFVTNKKGGYNYFNRDMEWKGFLVPTSSGGFAFFNLEKEWVLSLVKPPTFAQECETGHWIQEVSSGGKLIKLEDGSLWQVSSIDVMKSAIWLPVSEIAVCGNTMKNTDTGESVAVTRISHVPIPDSSLEPSQQSGYVIEIAVNDEVFVINGETYEAKTYCFGFEEGDRVEFIEGSALGVCVSAEILHLRSGKICQLWCE